MTTSFSLSDLHDLEAAEWRDSLDSVLRTAGPERARELLQHVGHTLARHGVPPPFSANTPYINTIPVTQEPAYPGDWALEERIRHILRWNAMVTVLRANRAEEGIGGHIATYASAAALLEVGFNHCFRAAHGDFPGDFLYLQGHCAPGIYARGLLEGRLTPAQLANFRRELNPAGGLSSYPHPWLMPDYWQFPTVSMGLGPLMAIYQARYLRYMQDRGLIPANDTKVWAFLGDGETDEPESLGALTLASREQLDNLIFVVNCNLQRLDGPVRGNGKIIQELEAAFRGAGWNVLKVVWGRRWDPLFAHEHGDLLIDRLGEIVDGEYQYYRAGGPTDGPQSIRDHLFGARPELAAMVADMTNQQIWKLNRGGHDPSKIYAAYQAAMRHTGQPTVILAKTIKGYGLGPGGEAKNITHQQKKLSETELFTFRDRFDIPLTDDQVRNAEFLQPDVRSPEIEYIRERRAALGGFLPARRRTTVDMAPAANLFDEFRDGSADRELSTTMAFVRVLAKLLRDPTLGKRIVPIVPDEARTFGMDSLFREVGIYSHVGQLYQPVDAKALLYYRESRDGQMLEEGISEAGAMSSWIAAATAHTNVGTLTIPFFIFYSMFGPQRIGDQIWAAADQRARGFLIGATAGRTTLAGEGLQHQDGHSHLLAYPTPTLQCYDPAFAYEIAVIIQDGLRRMYQNNEDIFYYITVANENYRMAPMPTPECAEGIVRGLYQFSAAPTFPTAAPTAQLIGSGSILTEVIKAQSWLAEQYGVAAAVWSATSYKALYRDACDCERWNWLHPTDTPRTPYITQLLQHTDGICVAASDYVKTLPESVARFSGRPWISLGTDGFGRSDGRSALRDHFEVDARHIVYATLSGLYRQNLISLDMVRDAQQRYQINPEKMNPAVS